MNGSTQCAALAIAFIGLSPPALAGASDEPALTDLVRILHQEGVLDEAQYTQLSARAAGKEHTQSWLDRISLSGDLRVRYERFDFDHDKRDRGRARYRARLGIAANVNDRADVFLRLASGGLDNRSTNESFGGNDDFGKDDIDIDLAYARISPFARGEIPELDGSLWFQMGRVPNPYRSEDHGRDYMLWDGDVNLEGISKLFHWAPSESLDLYSNAGLYVIDEESSGEDPVMWAGQIGGVLDLGEHVQAGVRTSLFAFDQLDQNFLERGVLSDKGGPNGAVTDGGGNLFGGLTGSTVGGSLNVIEAGAFLSFDCFEDWPVRIYGDYANNLDATSVFGAGQQDEAWGVGVEVGDKKKFVALGAGFWHIEANSFPSQFTDSDLFDGYTNREGWSAYLSREVLPNTEFNITAFVSDAIERGFPFSEPDDEDEPRFGGDSTQGADRVRLQFDVVYKFK